GCADEIGKRRFGFVGNAKRTAVSTQALEHLIVEPARVAELKRDAALAAKQLQEPLQPRQILLEIGRQTKKHWTAMRLDRIQSLKELPHRRRRAFQSLEMRDHLRRLESKLKR